MEQEEHQVINRIDGLTASGMLTTAIIFDGIQIILFLASFPLVGFGWAIYYVISIFFAIIGWLVFFTWFFLIDTGFMNKMGSRLVRSYAKRFVVWALMLIVELGPLANAFPTLTIGVALTIFFIKLEDNIENKQAKLEFEQNRAKRMALRAQIALERTVLSRAR